MEYSEFLGLSLPSRDNDTDIADINVLSGNFKTVDDFCGKTIPNMLQEVGDEFLEVTNTFGDDFKSLDLLGLTRREKKLGWISLEGKWAQVGLEEYVFVLLPVTSGDMLEITPNENVVASIACLKGFSGAKQGLGVDFSEDENWGKRIDIGSDRKYVMPDDAKYLYVATVYNGIDCTPIKCKVSGYDYATNARKSIQDIYKMIGDIENGSY